MIQHQPLEYRLEGSLKLRVARLLTTEEARFEFAADLMRRLGEKPQPERSGGNPEKRQGRDAGKPQAPKPAPGLKPAGKPPAIPPASKPPKRR
jgi:hypothetical protein